MDPSRRLFLVVFVRQAIAISIESGVVPDPRTPRATCQPSWQPGLTATGPAYFFLPFFLAAFLGAFFAAFFLATVRPPLNKKLGGQFLGERRFARRTFRHWNKP